MLVLLSTCYGVSICLLATVMGAAVGIESASNILFLVNNGVLKMVWRIMGKKETNIVLFSRGKLNSLEKIKSKTLTNADVNYEN